jgi:hypothetical protein
LLLDQAIADVRDGFKPIHRRIVYAMDDELPSGTCCSKRECLPGSPYIVNAFTRSKNQLVSFSHTPHRGGYMV